MILSLMHFFKVTTEAELWNVEHRPPALLVPGATIRFVAVTS